MAAAAPAQPTLPHPSLFLPPSHSPSIVWAEPLLLLLICNCHRFQFTFSCFSHSLPRCCHSLSLSPPLLIPAFTRFSLRVASLLVAVVVVVVPRQSIAEMEFLRCRSTTLHFALLCFLACHAQRTHRTFWASLSGSGSGSSCNLPSYLSSCNENTLKCSCNCNRNCFRHCHAHNAHAAVACLVIRVLQHATQATRATQATQAEAT